MIKKIDTGGISYVGPLTGSRDWYWGTDYTSGDLYEAEEIFRRGGDVRGTTLYLIRYPSGERFQPLPRKEGVCIGKPVMEDGLIYILSVDFPKGLIKVQTFGCDDHELKEAVSMELSEVDDCYNLMLHERTVLLSRQLLR